MLHVFVCGKRCALILVMEGETFQASRGCVDADEHNEGDTCSRERVVERS